MIQAVLRLTLLSMKANLYSRLLILMIAIGKNYKMPIKSIFGLEKLV